MKASSKEKTMRCGCVANAMTMLRFCKVHEHLKPGPPASPAPPEEEKCCEFFGVGNETYRGVYIPSREEYEAHGYDAANYERFVANTKAQTDASSAANGG